VLQAQRIKQHRGQPVSPVWEDLIAGRAVYWAELRATSSELLDLVQDAVPHIVHELSNDESPVERRLAAMRSEPVDVVLPFFPWLYTQQEVLDLVTVLLRD
jgi:hypothetical protein